VALRISAAAQKAVNGIAAAASQEWIAPVEACHPVQAPKPW
jgi:hypothetical protein